MADPTATPDFSTDSAAIAPLGSHTPLGQAMPKPQFRAPLGARSLSILDPSIFHLQGLGAGSALQAYREWPFQPDQLGGHDGERSPAVSGSSEVAAAPLIQRQPEAGPEALPESSQPNSEPTQPQPGSSRSTAPDSGSGSISPLAAGLLQRSPATAATANGSEPSQPATRSSIIAAASALRPSPANELPAAGSESGSLSTTEISLPAAAISVSPPASGQAADSPTSTLAIGEQSLVRPQIQPQIQPQTQISPPSEVSQSAPAPSSETLQRSSTAPADISASAPSAQSDRSIRPPTAPDLEAIAAPASGETQPPSTDSWLQRQSTHEPPPHLPANTAGTAITESNSPASGSFGQAIASEKSFLGALEGISAAADGLTAQGSTKSAPPEQEGVGKIVQRSLALEAPTSSTKKEVIQLRESGAIATDRAANPDSFVSPRAAASSAQPSADEPVSIRRQSEETTAVSTAPTSKPPQPETASLTAPVTDTAPRTADVQRQIAQPAATVENTDQNRAEPIHETVRSEVEPESSESAAVASPPSPSAVNLPPPTTALPASWLVMPSAEPAAGDRQTPLVHPAASSQSAPEIQALSANSAPASAPPLEETASATNLTLDTSAAAPLSEVSPGLEFEPESGSEPVSDAIAPDTILETVRPLTDLPGPSAANIVQPQRSTTTATDKDAAEIFMAPASPDGAIAATTFEPSISGTENLPNAEANSVPASSVLTPPASQTEPAVSTPAARQQTAAPLPEPESPAEIQRSPVTLTSFDLTQPTVTERAAADRSGRAKAGPSATPRRIAPTEPPAASPTTSAQATGPAESTPPNVSGSSLQRSPADLSTPDLTEAVNPAAKPPDSLAEMTESETSNPETAAVEASASPAGISPSSNLSVAPPEPAQSPTLQTKLTANASTRAPDDRDRSIEPEPLGKAVANNEALTETVSNNLEIVNSQAQSAPEAPETRSNAPEPGPNHIPEAINLQAQSVSETTSETADLSLLQPPTAAPQSLAELQNRATELSDSTVPAATVTASPQVAPIQTKAESGRVVPAPNSAAAQTGWPQLPQVLQPISNLLSPPPQRQATSEPLPTSKSLLQRKVPALSSSLTGYKPLFAAKSATPVSPGSSALMLQTQIEGTSATGEAMPETADIPGDWGSIAELMQISRPAATAVQPEPAIASPVKPENAYRDLQPFEGDRHLQAQGIMSAPVTHVSAQRLQAFTEPPATPVTSEPASAAEGNQSAATSAANIEKLAQAVYFRLRQRLALERERRGNNYSGRF